MLHLLRASQLQAQFNGKQTLNLGGMAKCNLNLLLSLINKK